MANQTAIFALGKVIIAAAWADGDMAHEEVHSLKDLLFLLPAMTAKEWAQLDMYIEEPVGPDERARLVADLQGAVRSSAEKKMALDALDQMIAADGEITPEEEQVADEIRNAINDGTGGLLGGFSKLMRGSVKRRGEAVATGPNREEHFDDFVSNKVFYSIRRRLETGMADTALPEETLRKLALAGGLMALIAHADGSVAPAEAATIEAVLEREWGVSQAEARFVAEVALVDASRDLDYHRLTRSFFHYVPDEADRLGFVDLLFQVAAADGFVTADEIREIRHVATSLKLTRQQFNQRKTLVPQEQREA